MRKVGTGFGDMGQKRVGQKDDLFLGFGRVHRVDGKQIRRQLARFRFSRFADGDARISDIGPVN